MRTLAENSRIGSASTEVAFISFSVGWRACSQRPGTMCSTIDSSAASFSCGSLTSVAVPTIIAER